jgi:hypothetical protein
MMQTPFTRNSTLWQRIRYVGPSAHYATGEVPSEHDAQTDDHHFGTRCLCRIGATNKSLHIHEKQRLGDGHIDAYHDDCGVPGA